MSAPAEDVGPERAAPAMRRTRKRLLAEVAREVELMELLGLRGPASILQDRLAKRGVRATLETLRSGDCRPLLARVWVRRARSARNWGPTNGHDLRPHAELVEHVLHLTASVARVKADLASTVVDTTTARERDPRSVAVCRHHATHVAEMVAVIRKVVAELGARAIAPSFREVSKALGGLGKPLSVRSIQRREEYRRVIREYCDLDDPRRPAHPMRAELARMPRKRLGAMVVRLQAELAEVNATFEAHLLLPLAA